MRLRSADDATIIVYQEKKLAAASCKSCGAKIYPKSLFKPHRNLHQRRQRWFSTQLSQLHDSFAHAQNFT